MKVLKKVNPHFEDFIFNWDFKTYLLVGGYGSSKSYHIALKILLKLLKERRKCLVVREVYRIFKDSTFALFKELISDLNLSDFVRISVSPFTFSFGNGLVRRRVRGVCFRGLRRLRGLEGFIVRIVARMRLGSLGI